MSADLHVHSAHSDGTNTPEEIVKLAKNAGLKTIAITDHDTINGVSCAQEAGKFNGLEVIPGIEFTTEAYGAEIHMLGYFIDIKNITLLQTLDKIQKGRVDRIYKIAEKLRALGLNIDADKIFEIAKNESPGRPHVAKALIAAKEVSTFKEAFDKYIDFNGPAYVSHYKLAPNEAIKLITDAKGIPVLAHPAASDRDEVIPDLIKEGLLGLEVFYPSHRWQQTKKYKDLAKVYGLLITGGTDFHGENSGREIKFGDLTITDNLVEKLKNEYIRRNRS